jgi:hypothetical protein
MHTSTSAASVGMEARTAVKVPVHACKLTASTHTRNQANTHVLARGRMRVRVQRSAPGLTWHHHRPPAPRQHHPATRHDPTHSALSHRCSRHDARGRQPVLQRCWKQPYGRTLRRRRDCAAHAVPTGTACCPRHRAPVPRRPATAADYPVCGSCCCGYSRADRSRDTGGPTAHHSPGPPALHSPAAHCLRDRTSSNCCRLPSRHRRWQRRQRPQQGWRRRRRPSRCPYLGCLSWALAWSRGCCQGQGRERRSRHRGGWLPWVRRRPRGNPHLPHLHVAVAGNYPGTNVPSGSCRQCAVTHLQAVGVHGDVRWGAVHAAEGRRKRWGGVVAHSGASRQRELRRGVQLEGSLPGRHCVVKHPASCRPPPLVLRRRPPPTNPRASQRHASVPVTDEGGVGWGIDPRVPCAPVHKVHTKDRVRITVKDR